MPIDVEGPRTVAEKQKAADAAISAIEKQYGKGSVFNMASGVGIQWPSIPTGIHSLDRYVIGCGGIPKGRITEVYGPEAGGKTTLTLHAIASAQSAGELCGFIDAEHALDPTYASKLGVNMKSLYVSQPDNGEQALEIAEEFIRSQAFGIVVVDSVAALVPKAELEGDMGDSNVGLQARLMSQAMRKLTGIVHKSSVALVFINQIREKIGVMFGSPETTTGGRALKFYSSVRLDVRRISGIKEGEKVIGNNVRIKAAKNKLGTPFRETEVPLIFGTGFDTEIDLLRAAIAKGIVEKSGSWLSFKGERLAQGETNAKLILADRSNKVYDKILEEVKKKSSESAI